MTVTASRLGSSPIAMDWSNLVSVPVSSEISPSRTQSSDPQTFADAWNKLKSRYSKGEVGFFDAPVNEEISQVKETLALAEQILAKGRYTDCLFLGIGGSALGPISLLSSLKERCKTKMRFHFMENPDPIDWKGTLKNLAPESTLVCAVTKSGTTFETMAQLLLAIEWLGPELCKQNLVAITDPVKGDLKSFATQAGIPTLHIAPSLGGRFSVFSPVGLLPAALAGLNVTDFLLGAKQVRDYVEKTAHEKNPLFILGHELIRHYPKRTVHVCMPYSTRLKQIGAWFVQLWGESLGKDGKGFTPLAAVGATDQHSVLQLLRDGPDDKVTFFITLDQVEDEVKIPRPRITQEKTGYPAFKILEGHTLQELLLIEYRATSLVLTKQRRPNFTLHLDRLDERSLGALYFAMATLTAITGTLWNVDPFDQPGVEEGKGYIREALNRASTLANHDADESDDNSAVGRLRRNRDTDSLKYET